jgi:hypothetical protein
MKWRYCADPGVDTLVAASSRAVVELGSDR